MRFVYTDKLKFEPAGDVLQVQGTLIYPGTFTGLDGKPVTFSKEVIKDIKENIDGNIPFKVTHFSDKIVGYATHFFLDENTGALMFKGYVFDNNAIKKIETDGYDHVSGEFDVDVDKDGKVVDGVLKAIAFVTKPAVPGAEIEEAKSVALSKEGGELDMADKKEEVKEQRPTKQEFIDHIIRKLQGKGLTKDVLDVVRAVLDEVIQVPYPYPYPQPAATAMSNERVAELEAKLSEKDQEIERLHAELEQYKAKFAEVKEKELKALMDELKKLGIKNPETIVEDVDDVEKKIAILQKIKENLALSEAPHEEVQMKEEKNVAQEISEAFGGALSEEEVKEIFHLEE